MRIIHEIPHSYLKITLFKHQQTYLLSIKNLVYEWNFNFRDGEINDIEAFVAEFPKSAFLKTIEQEMHKVHLARMDFVKALN